MLLPSFTKKPIRLPNKTVILIRALIHSISIIYLFYVFYLAFSGKLLGDPVQYLLDFTGIGAINLLLLSLIISPLAVAFKMGQVMRLRRSLGVYASLYALAHFGVFIAFELQFEWALIASEIVKRPYITVGFTALLILTALLITSITTIKKKMGAKWMRLHKFVYLATALALIHYIWSIKAEEFQPIIYMGLGLLILFIRGKKLNLFRS